jgi:hypothetical protein
MDSLVIFLLWITTVGLIFIGLVEIANAIEKLAQAKREVARAIRGTPGWKNPDKELVMTRPDPKNYRPKE